MDVVVIETPQLGTGATVHDGSVALVIDPQRDTDRIEAAAREADVRITHVAETHLHNDYVTGGLLLAEAHGAAYWSMPMTTLNSAACPFLTGRCFTSAGSP